MNKFLTFIIYCFLNSYFANAQWVQLHGPTGGRINAIAGNGMNVFAGTQYSAVYHSPSNGAFWTHASNGIPVGVNILSVATSGNALLAATLTYMYRSTDNGLTWNQTALNAATNGFRHVALIDTILFAGTYSNGIYKSVDDGITWTYAGSGLPHNKYARGFTKQGSNLFAGTWTGGIYKSGNNGASWTPSNNGMTSTTTLSMASYGSYIFAGTINGACVSSDSGANWSNFNNNLPVSDVNSLLVKGNFLFAGTSIGVYKYDLNTGLSGSWIPAINGLVWGNTLSLYSDGTRIFAGCTGGMFVTYDNGITWSESNTGLYINSAVSILQYGSHLLTATNLGLYDSQNGGMLWNKLNLGNSEVQTNDLVLSGSNLLVASNTYQFFEIKASSDSGLTWNSINGLPSSAGIISLEKSGNNVVAGTNGNGIYISYNNGLNWGSAGSSQSGLIVPDISFSGSTGYAAAFTAGLFYSSNGGQTWNPAPGTGFTYAERVKTDGNTVLVYDAGSGVFISTNGGFTWSQVTSLPAGISVSDFIIDGNNIVLGGGSGIYVSNDLGLTWTEFNDGLLCIEIVSLYRDGNRIYAGTRGSSVYHYDGLLSGNFEMSAVKPEILIYPNPLSGNELNINFYGNTQPEDTFMELLSVSGQLIMRAPLNFSQNTFKLHDVSPGLYTIRVMNGEQTWFQKLMVGHN